MNSRTAVNSGGCTSRAIWQLSTQTVVFAIQQAVPKNAVATILAPELKLPFSPEALQPSGAAVGQARSPCSELYFRNTRMNRELIFYVLDVSKPFVLFCLNDTVMSL